MKRLNHLFSILFLLGLVPALAGWAQSLSENIEITLPSGKVILDLRSGGVVLKALIPGIERTELLALESPARIVLDLYGKKLGAVKTTPISSHSLVSAVRLGRHADKLRIVLDVSALPTQPYPLERETRGVTLVVVRPQAMSKASAQKPLQTQVEDNPPLAGQIVNQQAHIAVPAASKTEPAPIPTRAISIEPTVKETPIATRALGSNPIVSGSVVEEHVVDEAQKMRPSKEESQDQHAPQIKPSVEPTLSPPGGAKLISGIGFGVRSGSAQQSLVIALSARPEFKVIKRGARLYEILIRGFKLQAKHLELPYYPPQDFVGLTHVVAQDVGDDVLIKLGVEQGVRLSAVADGTTIVIEAQSPNL